MVIDTSVLLAALEARREALIGEWVSQVTPACSPPLRAALARGEDRFRNPAASLLRNTLGVVFDTVVGNGDILRAEAALGELIRLRAVQDLRADEAIGFLLPLKAILRGAARDRPKRPRARTLEPSTVARTSAGEPAAVGSLVIERFEERIDRLTRAAARVYGECRQRLEAVAAAEARRRDFVPRRMLDRKTGIRNPDSRSET